jgi:hypothetical protein
MLLLQPLVLTTLGLATFLKLALANPGFGLNTIRKNFYPHRAKRA